MIRPDFHVHTNASDGVYTPAQVMRLAQQANVTMVAVTDHDTLNGLAQAVQAAQELNIAFLPGVEISTEGDVEVHILGYGADPQNQRLRALFDRQGQERIERAKKMGEKLAALGYPLDMEEVLSSAGSSIGRPHLARALVATGAVSSVQEAFERFLGSRCPAYVPRERLAASEAISMLREEDAVPVLAHPALIPWPMERLLPLLKVWQDAGLMGIEVYHPANRGTYTSWDRLVREHSMLVTGGSDFHDGISHGVLGETIQEWPSAHEDGQALWDAVFRNKK